jgi:ACT domain-containing protein
MRVLTVKKLYGDKSIPVSEICKTLNISRSTYYRYVALKPKEDPQPAA